MAWSIASKTRNDCICNLAQYEKNGMLCRRSTPFAKSLIFTHRLYFANNQKFQNPFDTNCIHFLQSMGQNSMISIAFLNKMFSSLQKEGDIILQTIIKN